MSLDPVAILMAANVTPTSPLKYSDYLAGAAIVTGVIGSAGAFAFAHPDLAGYFVLATTAFVALSQWLQSKGD